MQDLVGLKTSDTDIQTARHVTVLVKVEVFNRETSLSETVLTTGWDPDIQTASPRVHVRVTSILTPNTDELETYEVDIQTARLTVLVKVEVFNIETPLSGTVLLKIEIQTSKQQVGTLSAIVDEVRQAPVTDAASITVRRLLLLLGRRRWRRRKRKRWRNRRWGGLLLRRLAGHLLGTHWFGAVSASCCNSSIISLVANDSCIQPTTSAIAPQFPVISTQ